jgi:prolyl-tRNA synthetase
LLVNNWSNVVRWELRPRIFLRTTEFLWQEGHTCHATEADASAYARRILHEVYADFMESVLAIPVLRGRKTRRERFAGAVNTLTCEAMMRDGKALQMGTSHELGQNFAKSFGVQFTSAEGRLEYVWQTSWGASTRMVGGLIMCHGDDAGLRIPPRLAPVQIVVMVVKDGPGVTEAAAQLVSDLTAAGLLCDIDARTDTPFGRRAIDRELKGVPVRVEVGPRELAEGNATLVRRIPGIRGAVALTALVSAATQALGEDHRPVRGGAYATGGCNGRRADHRGGAPGNRDRVGAHRLGGPGCRRRGGSRRAGGQRAVLAQR